MGWVFRTLAIVFGNTLVFWAMSRWLPGFSLLGNFGQIAVIAIIFTLLNLVVKPMLKLILGPLIIITLGLGLIIVNMLLLFILDKLSNNLSIDGVLTLLYAAIITGLSNFILHTLFKKK